MVGSAINLNSGGSAGSGSGYGGQAAELPSGVEAQAVPEEMLCAPMSATDVESTTCCRYIGLTCNRALSKKSRWKLSKGELRVYSMNSEEKNYLLVVDTLRVTGRKKNMCSGRKRVGTIVF